MGRHHWRLSQLGGPAIARPPAVPADRQVAADRHVPTDRRVPADRHVPTDRHVVRHVVVGPERHGVVTHAVGVAQACGHALIRVAHAADVTPADLAGSDVVHLAFTDRLFGETIEAAVAAVTALADLVDAAGAALSVTLHDVPHDHTALQERRRAGYAQVIERCRGVVVNSEVELTLLGPVPGSTVPGSTARCRTVRCIPLPLTAPGRRQPPVVERGRARTVGVLGFLYPDRGYEEVLDALPPDSELLAIGEPSAGHDALVGSLSRRAQLRGVRFRLTGYVPEDDLPSVLAEVDVAIAPNRRTTASASINTWTAHGRRVLTPDSPYTREVRRSRPRALITYAPDRLADALRSAMHDPAVTWLGPGEQPAPTLRATAATYADHLATCVRAAPIRLDGGRWTVPGNRWDLLASVPDPAPPHVSVVVPWFEAQAGLDRLLTALAAQTHPSTRLEVVVADDGSAAPPELSAAAGLAVRTVRQDDRGFRAAAARNLGAAHSDGDVLAFLDADMVPEPGFIARLCRLPALAPDCLTVGRRRHARLDGWSPARIASWLDGRGPGPVELPEPDWLVREYAASHDLLEVDHGSYRFVISAVLAAHRSLFDEIDGFDAGFVGYGGEDWELAHRAYVAGGVFAHVRDAVAWHDGPDWAGRHDAPARRVQKLAETRRLARVLPDPQARGGARFPDCPAAVVRLADLSPGDTAECVRSAAGADCTFWHPDAAVVAALDDPSLRHGRPAPWTEARAPFDVTVEAAADLTQLWTWCVLADRAGVVRAGPVTVRARRFVSRARRWQHATRVDLTTALAGRHDVPAGGGGG